MYCKEVHYKFKGKRYFAIGLRNNSGGWELRNKFLKNCTSPKDVTHMKNGYEKLTVIEGMFDMLSIASHQIELRQESDFLVMNLTVFIQKVKQILEKYTSVELYLDNDTNGKRTAEKLMKHEGVKDMSKLYKGFKDLNEWKVANAKDSLRQAIQDVSLLPQKQSCFTPDGRKE